MLAYTYVERGKFELQEKQKPALQDDRDAIIRVTLASICTSDLHIKHGSVPRCAGRYRWARNGGRGGGCGAGSSGCKAWRQSGGKCRDVLRRMLFLQAWLCKQLH